jgi:hypothetical protein
VQLRERIGVRDGVKEGGPHMETPELEFFLYLLTRYVKNNELDPDKITVAELFQNINLNLTPVGGG